MRTVEHFRPETEFYTGERCYIIELHNTGLDAGCSIARARLEPGVTTRLHCVQNTIERYVIIEGEGEVEVAGQVPHAVHPLDVVNIAAGAVQRITNTGARDLIFLCICTPRFVEENYVDREN
jgi:mannose-6-phosphate isomerase-like protein (cupin superfamily)